jgi:NTP pyrophosphatase (non-canonical NTP hydrolase)
VFHDLRQVNHGPRRKFPDGNEPFQMVTRLAEEVGELASAVNHFEESGIKRIKHGEPDKRHLADEAKNVLTAVFQIVGYYEAGGELRESIAESLRLLRQDGYVA